MVYHILSNVANGALAKRFVEDGQDKMTLPGWAFPVFLLDAIVFLPILLFVGYTLGAVYPTLAMIEDPNPPAYEPVALHEEADDSAAAAAATPSSGEPKPVTASLRATNRLVYGVAGWRSYFRGLLCALVLTTASGLAAGIFSGIAFVGTLLASLALVQLSTTWVHLVISQPSDRPFWRRLPPLRKTFEATWQPTLLNWVAQIASAGIPMVIAAAFGLEFWSPSDPNNVPVYDKHAAWKGSVVALVAILLNFLVLVPSQVVLVRVQASLLPPDEDTIVPFDRSFEGRVEPAVVGGKGHVTLRDAFATFSRSSWIRLYVLYAKVFAISVVAHMLLMAVVVPEVLLMARKGN
jgi:hypothetical protein